MIEVLNFSFQTRMVQDKYYLQELIKASQPWAETHFNERISYEGCLNPPPSHKIWPFAQKDNDKALEIEGQKFSHSYPERFWPNDADKSRIGTIKGIRFDFGDYSDLIVLLQNQPMTRQAYLPIWFPEDINVAANSNKRVPCTLGYHFIRRNEQLHMNYFMRSCDYVRHFRDDIYLAGRLMQYTLDLLKTGDSKRWEHVTVGNLGMVITSLHCWETDMYSISRGKV